MKAAFIYFTPKLYFKSTDELISSLLLYKCNTLYFMWTFFMANVSDYLFLFVCFLIFLLFLLFMYQRRTLV